MDFTASMVIRALPAAAGSLPWIDEVALDRLAHHARCVAEAQPRLHLVSATDLPYILERHTADAAALALRMRHDPSWPPENGLVDLGSGGGFPGLVLAALFPTIPAILIERSAAKAGFLRHTAARLGLSAVRVIEGEFPAAAVGVTPDWLTSRAIERPEAVGKAVARWLPPSTVFWCQSAAMVPAFGPTFHVEPLAGPALPRGGLWRIHRR